MFLTCSSRCPSNGLRKEDLLELVDLSKRWGAGICVHTSFHGQKHVQEFVGLVVCRSDSPTIFSEVVRPRLVVE